MDNRIDVGTLRKIKTLKHLTKDKIREAPSSSIKHFASEIMDEVSVLKLRSELLDMLDILEAENKLETE